MADAMMNAPVGEEDETGFHFCWRNDHEDRENVSCVWTLAGGEELNLPSRNSF